jgi:osmoprotectant transport system permease protein
MIFSFLTAAGGGLGQWFANNVPILYKMVMNIVNNPDEFIRALSDHILLLVVTPVLMAILVAVPLGILATRYPTFEKIVMTLVNIIQTIPSLALLVLLLVIGLGLGKATAITALFLYSLLPILRNTVVGIKNVDPFLKEAALGMGMTNMQRLRMVELPLAFSVIMTGIRTATIICIGTGTLAAYVGAGGLGTYIVRGLAFYRNDMLLVGALPAALLALFADFLLGRLERALVPRGLKVEVEKKRQAEKQIESDEEPTPIVSAAALKTSGGAL